MKHSITWEEREKARRRLERETGTIIKDWGGKLPFAFVYPNSYYVGMSNLGLQTIYGWLNSREGVVCERVFRDQENIERGLLPLSVESQRPLTDFAVLAFSLNYEIDYFNIAPLLKASGIPLYSAERDEAQPLVIAGGPCITANPMPVAPFFDCLCIGEAEVLLPSILPMITENISLKREELLQTLSEVPGIYVPGCNYELDNGKSPFNTAPSPVKKGSGDKYDLPGTGKICSLKPVRRQWVKNLDDYRVHSVVLTRDTELSDLYLIEVQRGCSHSCRFCLVGKAFSPVRFHSLETLVEQGKEGLKHRRRLGLVGPAVTDHPQIGELLESLLQSGAQLSISSLRITSLTSGILEQMVKGGLRSIALAPEAGSECLRRSIKKGINEAQILEAVRLAAEKGMQNLKLYFMIGLPEETDADIQAIANLAMAGKEMVDKAGGKTRLTLNLAPFVPKAGTVFERQPMAPLRDIQSRIGYLKSRLANQGIQVKNESPHWSEVQTVLSRGNSSLAKVLEDVERESLPAWRTAVEKHQIDIDDYAYTKWDGARRLPWEIIQ